MLVCGVVVADVTSGVGSPLSRIPRSSDGEIVKPSQATLPPIQACRRALPFRTEGRDSVLCKKQPFSLELGSN